MRQAMQKSASGDEFGAVLEIIKAHRANALVSVNVEHLLTNWEIGGYLSAKIKHDGWGKSTIDGLVDYIHTHAPNERGYGRSSLYSMVAVYDEFTSPDFIALVARYGNRIVQPLAGQFEGKVIQPAAGQFAGLPNVQPAAAQIIPGFSNQSARRHLNGGNTAKARRRLVGLVQRLEYDIICV